VSTESNAIANRQGASRVHVRLAAEADIDLARLPRQREHQREILIVRHDNVKK
jgi:hypothetical protein